MENTAGRTSVIEEICLLYMYQYFKVAHKLDPLD